MTSEGVDWAFSYQFSNFVPFFIKNGDSKQGIKGTKQKISSENAQFGLSQIGIAAEYAVWREQFFQISLKTPNRRESPTGQEAPQDGKPHRTVEAGEQGDKKMTTERNGKEETPKLLRIDAAWDNDRFLAEAETLTEDGETRYALVSDEGG